MSFWSRFSNNRQVRVTREGKFFIGITLGVGFAAINTANNLLYLLLGMLLALIVVSGFLSQLTLRGLTVRRRLPIRAQVGRPHVVEIEVINPKTKIPSYAVEVEDLRVAQPSDKRCFFLKISAASSQVAAYRRTPLRRGHDHYTGFRIATRFPFGLFEKSRQVDAEDDLITYPAVDPVALLKSAGNPTPGLQHHPSRGTGEDILGLKCMRDGEDSRDIHWRKSAAVGQLVTRDRARDAQPEVSLVLDVARPTPAPDDWDALFEIRIRDLASRVVAHLRRGDVVLLRTTASHTLRLEPASGADPGLRFLALVDAIPAPTPPNPP
ncbi:MAG: DUF58 domain-containing protein [Myxococcales bacterium]